MCLLKKWRSCTTNDDGCYAVICHAKKELLDVGQKQAMATMLMNGEHYNDGDGCY